MAQTFTQVLYRLLEHPEYIEPLRQEVEAAVAEKGWTKAGMDKMHKIDGRRNGLTSWRSVSQLLFVYSVSVTHESPCAAHEVGVSRLVLRPFTFSNGVTIPAGTLVSLPMRAVQGDGETYADAHVFDGFRFSKLREQEGDGAAAKHLAVSTSVEHLAFGIGRHTW